MSRQARAKAPKKLFYKIGEVCEMTKTEPYVLRYWESEFPFLAPSKNRSGQRIYKHADIEMVKRIKELLYGEGYTIAGARRKLEEEARQGRFPLAGPVAEERAPAPGPTPVAARPVAAVPREEGTPEVEALVPGITNTDLRKTLVRVREELRKLATELGTRRRPH